MLRVRPGAGASTFPSGRYSDNTVLVTDQTLLTRKRRGPAPTGKGTLIGVRLQPADLSKVDAWIAAQPEPVSRPEAIRRILVERLG